MKRKRCYILVHLYPIVYGILILIGVNVICGRGCSIFLSGLAHAFSISRLITAASYFINNPYLILLLIMLILLEILRTILLGEKIMLLLEALLLFIYSWSIEIALAYTAISYIGIKILQSFIFEMKTPRSPIINCTPNTISCITINKTRGSIILIVVGLCILIHVVYSYFLYINILSMLTYSAIVIFMVFVAFNECKGNVFIHSILAAIPPFGVIPLFHDILMVKRTSTDNERK